MRKQGQLNSCIEAVVGFHDIDAAQVVWHGHYLKYLENARWALMDRLGFGLDAMLASGYSWPIVELHVKFVKAARYGDRLQVRASLAEWRNRLTITYLITNAAAGERVARAKTVQVAVDACGVLQFETPQILINRIDATLAQLAEQDAHDKRAGGWIGTT